MTQIANPKLGFARFPGFSLLFDNPGADNLVPMGKHVQQLACRVATTPELALYRSLHALGLEQLFANYYLFPLPTPSYHVTVFDGLNQAHLDNSARRLASSYQPALDEFLNSIGLYGFADMATFFTCCSSSNAVSHQPDDDTSAVRARA
jgi:hypothetical protein